MQFFMIAVSDEAVALTTGAGKITFRVPYNFVVTDIRASLATPQASGNPVWVTVKQAGASITSGPLTIASGAKTTVGSTQSSITTPLLADDAEMTVDVGQIGDGTAVGLKVTLIGYRPVSALAPTPSPPAPSQPPPATPPPAGTEVLVDRTAGTAIGNMTVFGLAYAFDGVKNAVGSNCAAISGAPGYVGKSFPTAKRFSRAIVYGPNDRGFTDANPSVTITVYGKNGTPSSPTDGLSLGTLTFTDTNNESAGRTVVASGVTATFTNLWVYINAGAVSTYCAELELYELV